MHTVCHDGCSTGSTAGTHRDTLLLGITNKIPNDQIVVYITHLADGTDFVLQPIHIVLRRILIPLRKSVIAQLTEVFFISIAFRHRESRQMVFIKHKFQIASLCDPNGVFKGLVTAGEQFP